MAYASASDVANYSRNLMGADSAFNQSGSPTIQAINFWLSAGCAQIETKLASCRYSTPAASGTAIYDHLKHLNALYAAAWAEMSRTNITFAPDERTRGQVYLDFFNNELGKLCDMDLTGAGLSRASQGVLYAGGISVSDKQRREQSADRLPNLFQKGQFKFPGTIDPEGSTASRNR